MMSKQAIVFDRVSKTFPKASKPSVNETSLEIGQGSFVTILGASGCGKTTLLKMVNRIIEPSSGTISIFGKDIRQQPLTELRRSIGYVIQQIGLFPHMTIEQNISTVPEILGWDREKNQVQSQGTDGACSFAGKLQQAVSASAVGRPAAESRDCQSDGR